MIFPWGACQSIASQGFRLTLGKSNASATVGLTSIGLLLTKNVPYSALNPLIKCRRMIVFS